MKSAARLASVLGLSLATACATTVETPPAPIDTAPGQNLSDQAGYQGPAIPSPGGGTVNAPALAEALAADKSVCARCSIDASRRFVGRFQSDVGTCGDLGAKVNYPLKNPMIQVIRGEQAGRYFPIGEREKPLDLDAPFEATLSAEINPEGWLSAIVWVTDATNRPCASDLTIRRR